MMSRATRTWLLVIVTALMGAGGALHGGKLVTSPIVQDQALAPSFGSALGRSLGIVLGWVLLVLVCHLVVGELRWRQGLREASKPALIFGLPYLALTGFWTPSAMMMGAVFVMASAASLLSVRWSFRYQPADIGLLSVLLGALLPVSLSHGVYGGGFGPQLVGAWVDQVSTDLYIVLLTAQGLLAFVWTARRDRLMGKKSVWA